ncbi:hypothetical protein EKN56_19255 [Limnobaculum zhutongyuii]|uniref:Uncharacterized protein n=1 Tax=Limnobaculum zhutongyuii TaxID=2498113 RepID=A0A411WQD1_9GAMM|nr:hypothetical protein [Limnobaculum zhutongyuii]QBH98340.1 hypothetical protein EKN56_19255 [Limnobaculum zhutongyuii]TQS89763.1 hypothetical protein ELQ32_04985 [Limnobaculum zhutongyuii]
MKRNTLVGISLSVIAIVILAGWLIWQFLFPVPVAKWVFYGEKPSELRGYIYPPAKNSIDGKLEPKPDIPDGDGALLTLWPDTKRCTLTVKSGRENISVTRFRESTPETVQVEYVNEDGAPTALHVQLDSGVSFWTYPDPNRVNDFIGWKFDNLAGQAIPVRFRTGALIIKIIDGTQYKRQTNGHWLYEKHQNGIVLESKEFSTLPVTNSEQNRQAELKLIGKADQWLSETLQDLSDTLSVPIPDQWLSTNSDPCQSVNTDM